MYSLLIQTPGSLEKCLTASMQQAKHKRGLGVLAEAESKGSPLVDYVTGSRQAEPLARLGTIQTSEGIIILRAGECSSMVEHLPSVCKILGLILDIGPKKKE
jgi:hypothetical protein